jgi:hypothetical protein
VKIHPARCRYRYSPSVNLATKKWPLLKGATKGNTIRTVVIMTRPAADEDDDPKERYPWEYQRRSLSELVGEGYLSSCILHSFFACAESLLYMSISISTFYRRMLRTLSVSMLMNGADGGRKILILIFSISRIHSVLQMLFLLWWQNYSPSSSRSIITIATSNVENRAL